MSGPRVRYDEPPQFVLHYPTCSACMVDLEHDGDGWQCPKCGTAWDSNAGDGDDGELYPDWAGEDFDEDLPITAHNDGHLVAWIEHPFERWVTDDGFDMRRCHKCYEPAAMHVGGAA
jgi:hypothetical protein